MKNKILKITLLATAFAVGIGVAASSFNKPIEKVEAVQHIDNYDEYHYAGTYYDNTDLTGTYGLNGTLRTTLTSLIHPTQWYTYGSQGETHLATQLQYADEDPNNSSNMVYLYTRDSVTKNSASTWNREHVWPQSLSGGCWGTSEAGTDLLHIRPTYNSTNGERDNDIYADTQKANPLVYNGMTYGYETGTKFEPLDSVKGDVARIIMYVWTAYKSHYSNLPNITRVFESYDTLLKWHILDKPDELEGHRNDYVQTSKQGNRNPFVDHPEFAWMVFGDEASANVTSACKIAYPSDGSGTAPTKTLKSIAISGEPNKKSYMAGESFNPTGLTVTGTYDDNSTSQISVFNCMWEPNPLTYGTTAVTCKYKNLTATYTGITVSKQDTHTDGYSVIFKSAGADGTSELGTKEITTNIETNNLVKTIDNASKVFAGTHGLKFGSRNAAGSLTFTLVEGARTKIQTVYVKTMKYGSESSAVTIKFDNNAVATGDTDGNDAHAEFTGDGTSATTVTIASDKRMYLLSVVIHVKEESVIPPTTSTPSSVPHSSEPSSSELSSSEYSSSSSTTIESSTISSEQPVSSSQAPASSQQSGSKKKGCSGSIIAVSAFTSVSALVGLVFLFSKKKNK